MNEAAVEVPERLKNRPLYRGFVVPWSVVIDDTGKADFRVSDMDRWVEAVSRSLCAMCGTALDYWVWYIGGQGCADDGVYFDLAMHEECCFYAVAVCPFLVTGRSYSERPVDLAGFTPVVRHDVVEAKRLYASKRRRDQTEVIRNGGGGLLVKTGPEAKRILIWPKETS